MPIDRIVNTSVNDDDSDEQIVEITLSLQNFDEYIGKERLKQKLIGFVM